MKHERLLLLATEEGPFSLYLRNIVRWYKNMEFLKNLIVIVVTTFDTLREQFFFFPFSRHRLDGGGDASYVILQESNLITNKKYTHVNCN